MIIKMPWLINNSTGCKYWTYNHDQKLIKKIHNHHKQHTTKKLKHKNSQICNNHYILYFDMSHFTDEEFNNSKNNKNNLEKIIKQHLGNNHKIKLYYKTRNLNTRKWKWFRKFRRWLKAEFTVSPTEYKEASKVLCDENSDFFDGDIEKCK